MEPYRDDKGNRFAILDSLLLPGGETSTSMCQMSVRKICCFKPHDKVYLHVSSSPVLRRTTLQKGGGAGEVGDRAGSRSPYAQTESRTLAQTLVRKTVSSKLNKT